MYTKPLTSIQCWHVHCEECWLCTLVCWNISASVLMYHQTWSSRDLRLGLETRFYKSRSRSWSWNLRVLSWNPRVSVLVLGPWRLGLRHSWSVKLRQNRKSYVKLQRRYNVQRAASIARKSSVRLPPVLLWNGYLATVVCWCSKQG